MCSDHFPIIIDILQPNHDNNRPSRWKTNKAYWIDFKTLCDRELVQNPKNTCMIDHFTETLREIANETIPKTSPTNKRNTPWLNDECRVVIQQRNAVLRKFNKEPSTSNLNTFKLLRAKAQKIIKQTKKSVGQIMSTNPIPQPKLTVWKMIRKISGKIQTTPLKNLTKNKSEVTNIKDIADALAGTFSANSSSNNKHKTENPKLSFKSNNAENHNGCFTLAELKEAIQKSHNTTVGPDEIHHEFLKQLPRRSLDYLSAALNEIWESSKFLDSWRVATIIPLPKPGKNSLYPSNYRPIELTSCLCKTMERMVNKRLVWFIESNNLYTNSQCGLRSQWSTMDHVVRLETSIREANIKRQPHRGILWSRESVWNHLEIWYYERPA